MSIGSNIKNLRVAHDLTQSDLGRIAGVTDKAVSSWESDAKVPRMGAVQRIADYFSIPKSAILDDSTPISAPSDVFASKLKALRKQHGLTQTQFAKEFNVANGTIAMWESGKRKPDLDTLRRIADFFGVTADYLLGADTECGSKPASKPVGDYAPRLRELREKRGLTLDQVADALGLRNQYISNYELGKRRPDYDTLSKLADFYHVSIDYLLGHDKTAPETEGGLTPEEKFFMENVGKLTPDQRAFLAAQIKVLLEGQK